MMDQPWHDVKRALESKGFVSWRWLNAGADRGQITALEGFIGHRLPQTLTKLLLVHDGEMGFEPGLVYGHKLLDVSEIGTFWKEYAYATQRHGRPMSSWPAGHIKPLYSNPHWIPIAHNAHGDFYGLDFDPDSQGTLGQVIQFGRNQDEKRLLAPTFDAFLVQLVADLEQATLVGNRLEWHRP